MIKFWGPALIPEFCTLWGCITLILLYVSGSSAVGSFTGFPTLADLPNIVGGYGGSGMGSYAVALAVFACAQFCSRVMWSSVSSFKANGKCGKGEAAPLRQDDSDTSDAGQVAEAPVKKMNPKTIYGDIVKMVHLAVAMLGLCSLLVISLTPLVETNGNSSIHIAFAVISWVCEIVFNVIFILFETNDQGGITKLVPLSSTILCCAEFILGIAAFAVSPSDDDSGVGICVLIYAILVILFHLPYCKVLSSVVVSFNISHNSNQCSTKNTAKPGIKESSSDGSGQTSIISSKKD